MLRVALYPPLNPMLGYRAGLPDDPDPNEASPPLLVQSDFLDDQSGNLLAICRCRRFGTPKLRQVLAECQYLQAIGVSKRN